MVYAFLRSVGVVMSGFPSFAAVAARLLPAIALTAWLGCAVFDAANAQSADCERLQATIDSMPRGDSGGGAARFQQAAAKQRGEIARTQSYANSLGCEKPGFLVFGAAQPPQCAPVLSQLQRMRGNLAQLESSAAAAGGGSNDARRRLLMARYNANCGRVEQPQQATAQPRPRDRGFFENLFGINEPPRQQAYIPPQPDLTQIPLEVPLRSRQGDSEDGDQYRGAHAGNVAVCVRTCDGGFFPVSYAAGRQNPEDLAALCTALCPNAAVSVYSYAGAADIESAVSLDGQPYRALPTAFRYRTTFDPSCSCKAPNQSWVAALSEAERLLASGGGHDIVVSEQKAAELSRPKFMPVKVKPGPQVPGKSDPAVPGAVKVDPLPTAALPDDGQAAKEATSGAAVATASRETTGISAGDGAVAAILTREHGNTQEIMVNGVRKRVRIIGPKL